MANINRVQTDAQPRFVLSLYLPYKLRSSLCYAYAHLYTNQHSTREQRRTCINFGSRTKCAVKGSTQGGSCLRTYLTRSLRRRSSLRVCMRMRISVIDVFTGSSFSFSACTGSLVHCPTCCLVLSYLLLSIVLLVA